MASSSLLDGMPEPPPSSSASRKLPRLGAGALITALLVLLCTLALMDLWRQYAINHADYWFLQYTMAVRSGVDYWKLGFRLEDLEKKLEYQRRRIAEVKQALATLDATTSLRLGVATSGMSSSSGSSSGSSSSSSIIGTSSGGNVADGTVQRTRKARLVVHRLLNNETKIGQIRCGDGTDTHVLRVGLNDFRTDTRDVCGVFVTTSSTDDEVAPHNIFEMVPLDGDAFGFRYLGNDLFLQAVPPPSDASSLPWKIVVGGPVPGAAERFRYTEDGYLYSPLMGASSSLPRQRLSLSLGPTVPCSTSDCSLHPQVACSRAGPARSSRGFRTRTAATRPTTTNSSSKSSRTRRPRKRWSSCTCRTV